MSWKNALLIKKSVHEITINTKKMNTLVDNNGGFYATYILGAAGIYLPKVNNRNTRTRCEICSKLTIKISERRQWRRSGVFIVNFEYISHLALVFLLLTLNI